MKTPKQRTRDIIMGMYRSQLKKFKSLSVYDDDGKFLFGKKTEFGTKVTPQLIQNTEKRLLELSNKALKDKGIKPIENYKNGKTNS